MNIIINKLTSIKKLFIGLASSNDYIWNFLNASAIKKYNSSKLILGEHEQQLLDDLKKDGVAVTKIENFSEEYFLKLTSFKNDRKKFVKSDENKTFFNYYLGGSYDRNPHQEFDYLNPLIEFSINQKIYDLIVY